MRADTITLAPAKSPAKVLRAVAGTMAGSQDPLRHEGSDPPTVGGATFLGGSVLVPAWAVALVGAVVVLSGALYFVWRVRRGRRGARFSHPTARRG